MKKSKRAMPYWICIAIGALIDGHNFAPALGFIAVLACLGICSYLFVVGKIDLDGDSAMPSTGRKA